MAEKSSLDEALERIVGTMSTTPTTAPAAAPTFAPAAGTTANVAQTSEYTPPPPAPVYTPPPVAAPVYTPPTPAPVAPAVVAAPPPPKATVTATLAAPTPYAYAGQGWNDPIAQQAYGNVMGQANLQAHSRPGEGYQVTPDNPSYNSQFLTPLDPTKWGVNYHGDAYDKMKAEYAKLGGTLNAAAPAPVVTTGREYLQQLGMSGRDFRNMARPERQALRGQYQEARTQALANPLTT